MRLIYPKHLPTHTLRCMKTYWEAFLNKNRVGVAPSLPWAAREPATWSVGEVVGKLYVEKYFPPEHKKRMDQLVKNLLKSFELSITELTWMTDETEKAAQAKLSKHHHQDRLHQQMA